MAFFQLSHFPQWAHFLEPCEKISTCANLWAWDFWWDRLATLSFKQASSFLITTKNAFTLGFPYQNIKLVTFTDFLFPLRHVIARCDLKKGELRFKYVVDCKLTRKLLFRLLSQIKAKSCLEESSVNHKNPLPLNYNVG